MKPRVLFTTILAVLVIFFVYLLLHKNLNLNKDIKISKDDENIILNYLDKETNDIAYSKNGRMYSSFKLLGTSQDKLYIWMSKVEYFKLGNAITHENGDAVSSPLVLYVKKTGNKLLIIKHDSPKDGEDYNKTLQKLFPSGIKIPDSNEIQKLIETTKLRAEENFK